MKQGCISQGEGAHMRTAPMGGAHPRTRVRPGTRAHPRSAPRRGACPICMCDCARRALYALLSFRCVSFPRTWRFFNLYTHQPTHTDDRRCLLWLTKRRRPPKERVLPNMWRHPPKERTFPSLCLQNGATKKSASLRLVTLR